MIMYKLIVIYLMNTNCNNTLTGLQGMEKLALGQGFAASPGAAVGNLALNVDDAVKMCNEGLKTILLLPDASFDDEAVLKVCYNHTCRAYTRLLSICNRYNYIMYM